MIFQAVLSNQDHPDYGVATIPFPIPSGQYAHCIELLEALEIGSALQTDCLLDEISGPTRMRPASRPATCVVCGTSTGCTATHRTCWRRLSH